MRRRYNISYFFATAFNSFWRNGFMNFATIVILVSALLICGSFTMLIFNIDYNIDRIDNFNEVVVFADLTADDNDIAYIEAQINALPQVASCTLVPKEESIIKERERYGEEFAHLFDRYIENEPENPLPDMFRIEYKDINEVDTLVYGLEKIEGVDNVKNRKDIADNINRVKKVITVVCVMLTGLLLFVSLFIISNTIKLTFKWREQEIAIMRQIGATNTFITLPFIIESMITALISSALTFVLLNYGYQYIAEHIVADYGIVETIPVAELRNLLIIGITAITFGLCILGTIFSSRRYMKV